MPQAFVGIRLHLPSSLSLNKCAAAFTSLGLGTTGSIQKPSSAHIAFGILTAPLRLCQSGEGCDAPRALGMVALSCLPLGALMRASLTSESSPGDADAHFLRYEHFPTSHLQSEFGEKEGKRAAKSGGGGGEGEGVNGKIKLEDKWGAGKKCSNFFCSKMSLPPPPP